MSNTVEYSDIVFAPIFSQLSTKLSGNYVLSNGKSVKVFTRTKNGDTDCPGHPMLFLDNIWPSSYVLSDFLVNHPYLCLGKRVIELGAGAALPSCVSYHLGAISVTITDFPANNVLENISDVIVANDMSDKSFAMGYVWGDDATDLLNLTCEDRGYHLILMADLLWKDTYSQHRNILKSLKQCLLKGSPDAFASTCDTLVSLSTPIALVAFAHRTTEDHSRDMDLEFFSAAKEFGFTVTFLEGSKSYADIYECDDDFEVFLYSLSH